MTYNKRILQSFCKSENMNYSKSSSIRYWTLCGLCCPLYHLPTQQSCDYTSLRELSTSLPSEHPFCASHRAQPDSFQWNTGSTLRVIPTLMCARVTSLDSAQALPKYREGSDLSPPNPTAGVTLPRPPLRAICPKNLTKENRSPWILSTEKSVNASSEIQ